MNIFEQLEWYADKRLIDNVYKEVCGRLIAIENDIKLYPERKLAYEKGFLKLL